MLQVTSITLQVLEWQPSLAIQNYNPLIRGHYFLYAELIFCSSITIIFAGCMICLPLLIFFFANAFTCIITYIHALHKCIAQRLPDKDVSMIRHQVRHFQKLQKALPDKDLSAASIRTFALSKPSKTSSLAYYMK